MSSTINRMKELLLATLLVLNKADATLSFIDLGTMKVTATIPTGEGPHECAVAANGTAVVANYGTGPNPGSTLSIVDVSAHKELKRLSLPLLRPHGLHAVGNHVYLTAEGSRAVARYDAASGAIDWVSGTGAEVSHMVVVAPGEKKIYVANIGSDSVSVLDLTGAPRRIGLKQIPAGAGPEGIDLSPDGKQLWTASRSAGTLAVIDTATDQVIKTLTIGTKMANRVKFTLDGKRVLVSDPPVNEVLVIDAATTEIVKRIPTAAGPSGIVIAPDGKRAFIACADARKVQILDLESWSVTGSVDVGNTPDGMAYAP